MFKALEAFSRIKFLTNGIGIIAHYKLSFVAVEVCAAYWALFDICNELSPYVHPSPSVSVSYLTINCNIL